MAAIIHAVHADIWHAALHPLLGYASHYAFGQQRGLQTLVPKAAHSLGVGPSDPQLVDDTIKERDQRIAKPVLTTRAIDAVLALRAPAYRKGAECGGR